MKKSVFETLQKIKVFESLAPHTLSSLADACRIHTYRPGDFVFYEGDSSAGLFFLITGQIGEYRTLSYKKVLIEKIEANTPFGLTALLTDSPQDNCAIVEKTSKVLFLQKKDFDRIVNKDSNVSFLVSLSLTRKLRSLREQVIVNELKTLITVIYNEGNPHDKAWLAMEVALSLKEQTRKNVLLLDLTSDPQKVDDVLRKRFSYDYILINLPEAKTALSFSMLLQADFILNLSNKKVDYINKLYNEKIRIVDVNLRHEKKLNRMEWYIGHLARVVSKTTVGLALGSGTVGGLAHIGVLKYIEENKIPIDMIAGCSGGALYGALWLCLEPHQALMQHIRAFAVGKYKIFNDFSWSLKGLTTGRNIKKLFDKLSLSSIQLENMKIPFHIVATNLSKNHLSVFSSGSLWAAIRASISIPIVFTPFKIKDSFYADGNIINPLPIDQLKMNNIDKVIAVYASQLKVDAIFNNAITTFMQARAITSKEIALQLAQKADFFINPDISQYGMFEYVKYQEVVDIGYTAAQKANLAKYLLP